MVLVHGKFVFPSFCHNIIDTQIIIPSMDGDAACDAEVRREYSLG